MQSHAAGQTWSKINPLGSDPPWSSGQACWYIKLSQSCWTTRHLSFSLHNNFFCCFLFFLFGYFPSRLSGSCSRIKTIQLLALAQLFSFIYTIQVGNRHWSKHVNALACYPKGKKENQFVATRFFGLGENDACRIGAVGHQSRVAITLRRRQNGK